MDEQQIRSIVQDELRRNYSSGSPDVPRHSHNGTDNIQIPPENLIGWSRIPFTQNGFGGSLEPSSVTKAAQSFDNDKLAIYPIPIIYSGSGVGFNGGDAPNGTMIIFTEGSAVTTTLYVRVDGSWYGVNFTSTVTP